MSMLSENRRKAKWTLNPRGNLWSKDDSKFGQKLMEKMGWEKGKGLGASQQGMTDIISVKTKDEKQGVGFDASHDDKWIAHQDDFAAVLAGLNQTHGTEGGNDQEDETVSTDVNVESLENKSKKLRKRVHYHKFTRGKDLTNYSMTDLSCILGSEAVVKKRKIAKEEEKEDTKDKESSSSSSSNVDHEDDLEMRPSFSLGDGKDEPKQETVGVKTDGGLVVIAGGNINDYFAKKMAELRNRNNKMNYPNFVNPPSVNEETDTKKKKSVTKVNDNYERDNENIKSKVEEDDDEKKKRKAEKKKLRKQRKEQQFIIETHSEIISKKSKKKNKKSKDNDVDDEDDDYLNIKIDSSSSVSSLAKKSKKNKKRKMVDEPEKENALKEEEKEEENENVVTSKKKKKSKKSKDEIKSVGGGVVVDDHQQELVPTKHSNKGEKSSSSKSKKKLKANKKEVNEKSPSSSPRNKEGEEKKNKSDFFKGSNLMLLAGYGKT